MAHAERDAVKQVTNQLKPAPAALVLDAITAGYKSQPVITDVTISVAVGGITAIVGPNGAGKSTLFKALFGGARLFGGSVYLNGNAIRIDPRELVRSGIAYVPQLRNIFPSLTVRENLEVGTYVRGGGSLERVFSVFPDLAPLQRRAAAKLSGGQQNMLAIGRALMSDPKVILLDEASGGLSPLMAQRLWRHIADLAKGGMAIAAVEQNVALAFETAHTACVISGGRLILSGPPAELQSRPDFAEMFLEARHGEGSEPSTGSVGA